MWEIDALPINRKKHTWHLYNVLGAILEVRCSSALYILGINVANSVLQLIRARADVYGHKSIELPLTDPCADENLRWGFNFFCAQE